MVAMVNWRAHICAKSPLFKYFSFLKKETFIIINYFLRHHVAYRILVPRQGIETVPPALKVKHLNHWTTGEVPKCFSNYK